MSAFLHSCMHVIDLSVWFKWFQEGKDVESPRYSAVLSLPGPYVCQGQEQVQPAHEQWARRHLLVRWVLFINRNVTDIKYVSPSDFLFLACKLDVSQRESLKTIMAGGNLGRDAHQEKVRQQLSKIIPSFGLKTSIPPLTQNNPSSTRMFTRNCPTCNKVSV